MALNRLLIVEDDPTLRMALEDAFAADSYDVVVATDGVAAEEVIYEGQFSLVILDLMMPRKGGLEVLKNMRERGLLTPVVLLTARGNENDKVLGLELGADDYVTKPFGLRELKARVRALIRKEQRVFDLLHQEAPVTSFSIGSAFVDLETLEIRRGEQRWPITPIEAAMLNLLNQEAGRIVSRAQFLKDVWQGGGSVTNRTIDTHILNLRKKLEGNPKEPQFLKTVHGAGYKLTIS